MSANSDEAVMRKVVRQMKARKNVQKAEGAEADTYVGPRKNRVGMEQEAGKTPKVRVRDLLKGGIKWGIYRKRR